MAAINYRVPGSVWLFLNRFLFNNFISWSLIFIFQVPIVQSQDNTKNKDLFIEAESYFLYEEFSDALPIYIKLKGIYPESFNLDYKIGRCLINIPYEKHRAASYLEDAAKHISLTCKEGNFKETNAPLDALFYLGDAYRVTNQLDKAIKSYENFKTQSNNKEYDQTLVDDQIKACKRAMESEKNPVDYVLTNIGEVINSRFSETNPVVSENENMMVYASKLPFYEALYYSKKENGKWTTPVNMIPELEVDGDCYPTSLSSDGTELYIYRNNEFKGDIFVTNFQNGRWSKLRKLNDNINTKYWESHACISHDGKTLYFTSNRKGGYGGLDIYKSTRTSGDNWGIPVNLGSTINSTYNEDCPFLLPDGKRLYFSSFGHESMGGYDIFYSDLKPDSSWSDPVNLDYPINSTDDDLFFLPLRDGSIAYTAKYLKDGFGKYDIYRYELYSDQHPKKYQVTGSIQIPTDANSNHKVRLAVYDVNKKDTILRQVVSNDHLTFETAKGNYQVFISGQGLQPQMVPVIIPKGYAKNEVEFSAVMKNQKFSTENYGSGYAKSNPNTPKNELFNFRKPKPPVKKAEEDSSIIPVDTVPGTRHTVTDTFPAEVKDSLPVPDHKPVPVTEQKKPNKYKLLYLFMTGIFGIIILYFFFLYKRRKKE